MHFKFHVFFFCVEIKWNCTFSDFYSLPRIYALCSFFLKKEKNCLLFPSFFVFVFKFSLFGTLTAKQEKKN